MNTVGTPKAASSNTDESFYYCGDCSPGHWACADGTCVSSGLLCDDADDCPDGSDEKPVLCGGCEFGFWQCSTGECIQGPCKGGYLKAVAVSVRSGLVLLDDPGQEPAR